MKTCFWFKFIKCLFTRTFQQGLNGMLRKNLSFCCCKKFQIQVRKILKLDSNYFKMNKKKNIL